MLFSSTNDAKLTPGWARIGLRADLAGSTGKKVVGAIETARRSFRPDEVLALHDPDSPASEILPRKQPSGSMADPGNQEKAKVGEA
jgi:hypothetical protein